MIPEDEKIAVQEAMKQWGGNFVKCLGDALTYADLINAQKIKDTWPTFWAEYRREGMKKR